MICCYCFKKLRFWQKHDGCSHDRCRKIWGDGYDVAWNLARETLWLWNLPDLNDLRRSRIGVESSDKEFYEKQAQLTRMIQKAYTEPTVENGMLAEGEFTPKENP